MDKTVLEQYVELKEEIKDLHNRIDRDRRRLVKIENEGVVSDTVKGTRKDGPSVRSSNPAILFQKLIR